MSRAAAVDNTAVYGFCAGGLIQHPEAFDVGSEFMLRAGVAVYEGQAAFVPDRDHAAAGVVGHFQYMPVEVNGDFIVDWQVAGKLNVAYQLDNADLNG